MYFSFAFYEFFLSSVQNYTNSERITRNCIVTLLCFVASATRVVQFAVGVVAVFNLINVSYFLSQVSN